jgi:hypothetical protein
MNYSAKAIAARKIGGKTVILTAELQRYVAELPAAVIAPSHRRRGVTFRDMSSEVTD